MMNNTRHFLNNDTYKLKDTMLQHPTIDENIQSHDPRDFLNNDDKSTVEVSHKIMKGPHMSIMQLLLALLYLAIIWDILFIFSSLYFPSWLQRGKKPGKGSRRHQHNMMATTGRTFAQRRYAGKMTLDFLWGRIMAEARRLQRADIQHRTITQAMMETRLEAKGQLERDRSLSKTCNNAMSRRLSTAVNDHKIDMVRWAARISSDHDPRVKK